MTGAQIFLFLPPLRFVIRIYSNILMILSPFFKIAVAALHPEQAVWEPLMVGMPHDYHHQRADIPWMLKISLEGKDYYISPHSSRIKLFKILFLRCQF